MSLQDTFYLLGIIYMSLMLLIMLITVVAVLVIKAKVNAIHRHIEEKLNTIVNVAHMGEALVERFKRK